MTAYLTAERAETLIELCLDRQRLAPMAADEFMELLVVGP